MVPEKKPVMVLQDNSHVVKNKFTNEVPEFGGRRTNLC